MSIKSGRIKTSLGEYDQTCITNRCGKETFFGKTSRNEFSSKNGRPIWERGGIAYYKNIIQQEE